MRKTLLLSGKLGKEFLNFKSELDDNKITKSSTKYKKEINEFVDMINLVFETPLLEAKAKLIENKTKIMFNVIDDNQLSFKPVKSLDYEPIMVETPLIWNFTDFF